MMSNEKQNRISISDRKLVIKRLVIYVILSYLPFYIGIPIINHAIGAKLFVAEEYAGLVYGVGVLGMLIPSIAHVLTRLITKEGFDDLYMRLNIKGNVKYYLASVFVKLIESFTVILLVWRIYVPQFSAKDIFGGEKAIQGILIQFSATLILIVSFFGEEWGWRGYMMPKLLEITSKPVAILVGGIIWGLWHAPLTVSGHNFGIDYVGYPYVGILLMCVFSTAVNSFLTLLTERTKSILPACICHGVNNNLGATILLSIFASEAVLAKVSTVYSTTFFALTIMPSVIVGIISLVLFCKKK